MNDDKRSYDDSSDFADIEIEADETADIESAINEALAAVEKSVRNDAATRRRAGAIDEVGPLRDAAIAPADEVSALHEELADLRDRSARTLADFDNYRKRIERERQQERRFTVLEVLREFLTVIDNLERALASDGPQAELKTGVELILRQMRDLLRAHGAQRIPAVGQAFDPRVHEAVSRYEDPTVDTPTVSEEMQPGYILHDRLMRPSIVKVAMPEESAPSADEASEEEIPASN